MAKKMVPLSKSGLQTANSKATRVADLATGNLRRIAAVVARSSDGNGQQLHHDELPKQEVTIT